MNFLQREALVIIQNNSLIKSFPNKGLLNYLKDRRVSYLSKFHNKREHTYNYDSEHNKKLFMLIYNDVANHQEQRLADLEKMTCYYPNNDRIIMNLEPDYSNIMSDPFDSIDPKENFDNIIPIAERLDNNVVQLNLITAGLDNVDLLHYIKNIYRSPINFTYLHIDTLLMEYSFEDPLLPGDLHKILGTLLKTRTLGVVEFTNISNNPCLVKSLSNQIVKYIAHQSN